MICLNIIQTKSQEILACVNKLVIVLHRNSCHTLRRLDLGIIYLVLTQNLQKNHRYVHELERIRGLKMSVSLEKFAYVLNG